MEKGKRKMFGIVKEVLVEYYFEVEATSMREAKRLAKRMEAEGELTLGETGYNWLSAERLTVMTEEEFSKPSNEAVGEEVKIR